MKCLVFILALLFSVSTYAQSVWTTSRTEVIPAGPAPAGSQQVPLQLVVDETSPWASRAELLAQIEKSSKILGQCGVVLGQVEVKYVRYSPAVIHAMNNENPYRGPAELALMNGDMSATRPVVFLFNRQIPSSARAITASSVQRMSVGNGVDVRPLLHCSVITDHHRLNQPIPSIHTSYSTFAHELAHIFGNLDHVDEPNNLMTGSMNRNAKTGRLNPEQCRQIQTYSLANFSNVREATGELPSPSLNRPLGSCP